AISGGGNSTSASSNNQTATVTITAPATPHAGDVWQIAITEGTTTKIASYTWLGTESGTAANIIAEGMRQSLGSPFTTTTGHTYNFTRSSNVLTILTTYGTNGGSPVIANSFTVATVGTTPALEGQTSALESSAVTLSGTPADGKVYALKLTDGASVVTKLYPATSTSTLGDVVTSFTTQLSAYNATAIGNTIIVTKATAITLADADVISTNQADHGITLAGVATPAKGVVYAVTLTPTPGTVLSKAHAASGGESLNQIAAAIAADFVAAGLAGYSFAAVGDTVFVSASGNNVLSSSLVNAAGVADATVAVRAIAAPASGATVSVIGGGSVLASASYTGSLSALVTALNGVSAFTSAGYVATQDGSNLFVSVAGSPSFELYVNEDTVVAQSAATLSTRDGVAIDNEVWTIKNVDSAAGATQKATYTASAASETLSSIATTLAGQLDTALG